MAGYSNEPVTYLMPPLPPETMPYFIAAIAIFAASFFIGVHYKMHVVVHGFPPFYVLWLKQLLGKFFH